MTPSSSSLWFPYLRAFECDSCQGDGTETEIIIDVACTTTTDAEMHEKALDIMENLQMKVINRRN